MNIEELEMEVTDFLTYAIDRSVPESRVSMLYCRQALEAIVEYLWFRSYGEDSDKKMILSQKIKKLNPQKRNLFWNVNKETNAFIHYDPEYRNNPEKVTQVIGYIEDIMKKVIGRGIEVGSNNSLLLQNFNSQLDELKSEAPSIESKKDPGMRDEHNLFMYDAIDNWRKIISEIYDFEFSEMDNGPAVLGGVPAAFFLAGKTHLFVDQLLCLCKEEINPQAQWWDVERSSSLEELASEMVGWIDWLNMRLVPDGEEGEVVQLYPRLDYLPPDEINFKEIRRQGVYSILKEAFWLRGVDEMRPGQLMSSLNHLGCDLEWSVGSRNKSLEVQIQGIPENCIKWLDCKVVKNSDGDEILLSLKGKNRT
jgi:hypothetical protein